ncbi:MAG: DUF4252 domain-containing protein [Saprospiraceae bacterium]|nr:DUF4252 domain-containing protein [Saprospiraceae bacterium]
MRTFLIAAVCLLPLFATAQIEAVENFYQKYKSQQNITDVNLSGWLLKATSMVSSNDEADKDDFLKKITYFRALIMEESNPVKKSDFKKLKSDIRKAKFEELIKVKDGGSDIEILVKDDNGFITDAILLVNDKEDFVLLSMEGRFRLSDFENININIEGADHFKKAARQ